MSAATAASPLCQTIAGTVYDPYRVPIAGASVRVDDSSCGTTNATSDGQGRYTASVYPTRAAYGTASKTGYANSSHSVSFSLVATTANDFTLLFAANPAVSPAYVRPGQSVSISLQTTAPPARPGGSYLCSWGGNQTGQLGTGASGGTRSTPGPVAASPTALLDGVRAVSGPASESGGVYSVALMHDGTVRTWGSNANGQLGVGSTTNSPTPVTVKGIGGSGTLSGVVQVVAGGHHALALLADGTVAAWGLNTSGQTGDGAAGPVRLAPTRVVDASGTGALSGVVAVAAGEQHSLALKADGTVWGWGHGSYTGTTEAGEVVAVPTQVQGTNGGTLAGVVAIAAGGDHSHALLHYGLVVGWGQNADGQVGDGTTTFRQTPREATDENGLFLTGIDRIAAGSRHSLARRTDGTLLAWGANDKRQLGTVNGPSTRPNVVVRFDTSAPLGNVASLAAGASHSVASLADGTVMTWGGNDSGQLGRGDAGTSDVTRAQGVGGAGYLAGATAVAAGRYHTLALRNLPCDRVPSVTKAQAQLPSGSVLPMAAGTTDVSGWTTWTATFANDAAATDGTYWVKLCVVDAAFTGNCDQANTMGVPAAVSPQLSRPYAVDGTAPTMNTTNPRDGTDTLKLNTGININWREAGIGIDTATATMTVDGAAVPLTFSGNNTTGHPAQLAPGIHTVVATIKDKLGNGPGSYTWRFNLATASTTPGTAQTPSPVSKTFPAGTTSVVVPSVPITFADSSFTVSSVMRSGLSAGHVRVPLSALRAQFSVNGLLPSEPQPVGLADRTIDRSFAVLAPSPHAITGVLTGDRLDVGPVTVSVPTQYVGTGGTVTLTLESTNVGVTLDDSPTAGALDCDASVQCHVAGVLHCSFDSTQAAQRCDGTTGQMYLNVAGTKHLVSAPAINDNDTTATFPPHAPVGETPPYEGQANCAPTFACTNLLENWGGGLGANLKATWSVGPLFGVYQHNYFFGVTATSVPSTTAAWQQSNVHAGSAACVEGASPTASARLLTFGNSVEATTATRAPSGLTASTTGAGVDVGGHQEVVLRRLGADGVQHYAVGNTARLGDVLDDQLQPIGTFAGAIGSSYADAGLTANSAGAYNAWSPTASANTRPVELMTGTEFTGTAETFSFRTSVYVDFIYENTDC